MKTIINPWQPIDSASLSFFTISDNPIHHEGEYAIYHYRPEVYMYTFRDMAILQTAAPNREVIDRLIAKKTPRGEEGFDSLDFLHYRALRNLEVAQFVRRECIRRGLIRD